MFIIVMPGDDNDVTGKETYPSLEALNRIVNDPASYNTDDRKWLYVEMYPEE